MKKIIAINAGPRTGWNTDQLIHAAKKAHHDATFSDYLAKARDMGRKL